MIHNAGVCESSRHSAQRATCYCPDLEKHSLEDGSYTLPELRQRKRTWHSIFVSSVLLFCDPIVQTNDPCWYKATNVTQALQKDTKRRQNESHLDEERYKCPLNVLVFMNVVFAASMREGGDLLGFLTDAFEKDLPLDPSEPTKLSEMEHGVTQNTDTKLPTVYTPAECKALEVADVPEERSAENSDSDSQMAQRTSAEESKETDGYKMPQQMKTLQVRKLVVRKTSENPKDGRKHNCMKRGSLKRTQDIDSPEDDRDGSEEYEARPWKGHFGIKARIIHGDSSNRIRARTETSAQAPKLSQTQTAQSE
ncbi:hypothetical protein DNTS_029784 [Danionella cerebrum]|uniref:Uncharacterized protein n=1 Tax=Danionella cerebrum TaxID=2873325 RepID=A0A553QJC9_9TELE|nr:hypothetical protein DNTS_029784 [Danionella translucida]